MLLTHGQLFQPVDLQGPHLRQDAEHRACATGCCVLAQAATRRRADGSPGTSACARSRSTPAPIAQFVVDLDGTLVLANDRARAMFGLDPARPRAGRSRTSRCRTGPIELRSLIEKADDRAPGPRPVGGARAPGRRRVQRTSMSTSTPLGGGRRRAPRRDHRIRRTSPSAPASRAGAAPARAGAGDRVRGAPVDQRGAGDDQRGAPVDDRGARDHERGAPVHQRGARDDERGAPVHQRGAPDVNEELRRAHGGAEPRQRVSAVDPRQPARRRRRGGPATSTC